MSEQGLSSILSSVYQRPTLTQCSPLGLVAGGNNNVFALNTIDLAADGACNPQQALQQQLMQQVSNQILLVLLQTLAVKLLQQYIAGPSPVVGGAGVPSVLGGVNPFYMPPSFAGGYYPPSAPSNGGWLNQYPSLLGLSRPSSFNSNAFSIPSFNSGGMPWGNSWLGQGTNSFPMLNGGQGGLVDAKTTVKIMKSEGATCVQDGRREYFGVRSNHPFYSTIRNAVERYGAYSPQTVRLMQQYLSNRVNNVKGFSSNRKDVTTAMASLVHMRGEKGAAQTINMMAGLGKGGSSIHPLAMQRINSMSRQQFASRLYNARIAYDKSTYGHYSSTINGRRGNWWSLYAKGLVRRYHTESTDLMRMA